MYSPWTCICVIFAVACCNVAFSEEDEESIEKEASAIVSSSIDGTEESDALCLLQTHVNVHFKKSRRPDLPASQDVEASDADKTHLARQGEVFDGSHFRVKEMHSTQWTWSEDMRLKVISGGVVFMLLLLLMAAIQLASMNLVKMPKNSDGAISEPISSAPFHRWPARRPPYHNDLTSLPKVVGAAVNNGPDDVNASIKPFYIADENVGASSIHRVDRMISPEELSTLKKTLTCQVCIAVEACRCVKEAQPVANDSRGFHHDAACERDVRTLHASSLSEADKTVTDTAHLEGSKGCKSSAGQVVEVVAEAPMQESLVDGESSAALDAARSAVCQAVTRALQDNKKRHEHR